MSIYVDFIIKLVIHLNKDTIIYNDERHANH